MIRTSSLNQASICGMLAPAREAVKQGGGWVLEIRGWEAVDLRVLPELCNQSLTPNPRFVVQSATKEEAAMVANELCFLSIAQLAEQIKKQAVSPVEVTQAYL